MKMRYNVNIAVELDSDDWAEAYGIDPDDAALIRQDITTSLLELVEWHLNERLTIPATVSEIHGSS
jgi:hypothetical protein